MPLTESRRAALALTGAAALSPLAARMSLAAPMAELALWGPPAGPSVTLAHATATGMLSDVAEKVAFNAWRSPDELRAGLTSGYILLSVVPVQAAANLCNRGLPIRLANVMTNGLLFVISDQPDVSTMSDLAGLRVAVPFRGDTPEIIFDQLLEHHGMMAGTDVEVMYVGSPVEAVQLVLAGRADAALNVEPAATAAILRGTQAGKDIRRVIDIQTEWGKMTGAGPMLPQAGLAITGAFLERYPDAVPVLLAGLENAVADVLANPQAAAENASGPLDLPVPVIAASIPNSKLVARAAGEARSDIERMLTAMADEDMARIGGKMPDDQFYL